MSVPTGKDTRNRLLNKEKTRFLALTRAKEFGGTTAFHIAELLKSERLARGAKEQAAAE